MNRRQRNAHDDEHAAGPVEKLTTGNGNICTITLLKDHYLTPLKVDFSYEKSSITRILFMFIE